MDTLRTHGRKSMELAKIEVVTTCNKAQYETHGRACVKSFIRHWPAAVRLRFYNEDMEIDDLPIGCLSRPLPEWFTTWKSKYRGMKDANGRDANKNRPNKRDYDFKRDCIRFGHKIGAFVDAAEKTEADILIWMDADIVTDRPVDYVWLASLFPQPAFIAWLDRVKTYPECGFFMVNMRHLSAKMFIGKLRDMYESGAVFDLPQTHDSFVIEFIIARMMKAFAIEAPVSLSGSARASSDPFSFCRLSERMQHLKGKKKFEKRVTVTG
jgi:hypothetical protein